MNRYRLKKKELNQKHNKLNNTSTTKDGNRKFIGGPVNQNQPA